MQGIRDIIDIKTSLGFNWFYGDLLDQGYLRRMLFTNPSLEALYDQLKEDIEFVKRADRDLFISKRQLKAFKKIKQYLEEAKDYISDQLKKKKKTSKTEEEEIKSEIRSLDKDLRDGLIDKDEHDYAVRVLLRPAADDLSEIKSKFEDIDQKVKQQVKKYGYEEEDLEFDEEDEVVYDIEPNVAEKYTPDINKLVDENSRRFTMEEFNDIYEDLEQVNEDNLNVKQQDKQNDQQALAIGTILKQRQQAKKTGKENPAQSTAAQKNAVAKLTQLKVDPKLIAQLQADGKL